MLRLLSADTLDASDRYEFKVNEHKGFYKQDYGK